VQEEKCRGAERNFLVENAVKPMERNVFYSISFRPIFSAPL